MSKPAADFAREFDNYHKIYREDFLSVLKHLVATRELRFDAHLDGSYFVRGLSVETGLGVERSFKLREATVFSRMLEDGLLKPFRSSNKGNTFDLNDSVKVKAKKFLE
ncbi:MAG: hypothetical protein QXR53_02020 [Candidatus Norongarragalinales archaeon]